MTEATLLLSILALTSGAEAPPTEAEKLHRIVEDDYDAFLELNPVMATFNGDHRFNDRFTIAIAPEHREESLALHKRSLRLAGQIDGSKLDEQDRLTLALFARQQQVAIEGLRFPDHLLPFDQLFSVPSILSRLGAGTSFQPFETVQDYENWLKRLEGWPRWVDQAIANMREGVAKKIVHPKVVMAKTLDPLASQVVDDPEQSAFWGPVARMPANFSPEDRQRLQAAYRSAIRKTVVPGYRKLHGFIRDEYIPACRESAGWAALPKGKAWYEAAVRHHTTTRLTPAEIHQLGIDEVVRISAAIRKLREEGGRSSLPRGFKSEQAMLDSYKSFEGTVEKNLSKLFKHKPAADFEVRAVEKERQATSPGAFYLAAAPDGSRPGVFFVNTRGWPFRNRAGNEALFLHEAIPGHHFQISLQRELTSLPRFRRFSSISAYSEGWGLYVESLGEDLGLYRDPASRLGALYSELFRARRLVVDTGLHAMGWSRDKAIQYLGSESEVDRYMVMPGQALAYKVGELKITELRRRAEKKLGKRFDIREFHDVILRDGAMPLDLLETKIDRWIETVSPRPDAASKPADCG